MNAFRFVTGDGLETCPWRGYSDPWAVSVMRAHAACGDGGTVQLELAGYPNDVIDGVEHYRRVLHEVMEHDAQARRKKGGNGR